MTAGSPAAPVSSSPFASSPACSAASSSNCSSRPSAPAGSSSRHALSPLNHPDAFARYLQPLRQAEWVVYAKRPFAGPHQVLDYLGQYTHRVAISNHRLLAVEDGQVRFRWRDYRHHRRLKTLTLSAEEFIRRFLLHVLPKDFHRIRYFGFLACRHRQQKLALCRRLLDMPPPEPSEPAPDYHDLFEQLTGASLLQCPACQRGCMLLVGLFEPGEPPPPEDSS